MTGILDRYKFVFDRAMNLFLPSHYTKRPYNSVKGAIRRRLKTFVSWKDIYSPPAKMDDLVNVLKPLDIYEVLAWLTRINADIENNGILKVVKQEAAARNLFRDDSLFKVVITLIRSRNSILINSAHIENLMRLAIVYCEGEIKDIDRVLGSLGKAILMYGDMSDEDIELKNIKNKPKNIARELMIQFLIRASYLSKSEDMRYSIARNIKLFRDTPGLLTDSPIYIDLGDILNRVLGISLDDYIACTLALLVFWYNYDIDTGKPEIFLTWDTLFKDTNVDGVVVEKYLKNTCKHIKELKKEILRKLGSINKFQYDRLDIIKYPLIHLNNHLGCLSLDYFAGQLSDQLYWYCFDECKKQGKKDLERFTSFYGEIVHKYVNDSFMSVCGSRYKSGLFFNEGEIDGLIVYPDELIVVETKTAKLRYETVISGDLNRFKQDITKMISDRKGVYQLDKAVKAIRRGDLNSKTGLNISKYKIYPILILSNPLPLDPFLWDYYSNIIESNGWLSGSGITPITIMDLEELDMLIGLKKGLTILDVLRNKTKTQLGCAEPMKNYLFHNNIETLNNYLVDKFAEELRKASKRVYGKDLN